MNPANGKNESLPNVPDGQRKIRYRILGALDVTGLTARHPNQSRRWVRLASFNLAL
jgi:hypothetical protein